jgi:hypothetical protein
MDCRAKMRESSGTLCPMIRASFCSMSGLAIYRSRIRDFGPAGC